MLGGMGVGLAEKGTKKGLSLTSEQTRIVSACFVYV
jgi:hypothetical protein